VEGISSLGIFFTMESTEEERRVGQNYRIKGADWYAGARFVDLVLALGVVGAPRGDLGPTASSS
jgi:hypothetical protein